MSGVIEIGYWGIRGLQQPIRCLLEYTKLPYKEDIYTLKKDANGKYVDRSEWYNVKDKQGLDFSNLPYLKDGDVKLTQSTAILRYIARKAKPELLGNTNIEQSVHEMVMDELIDFRSAIVSLAYRASSVENFQANRAEFIKTTMKNYLTNFSKYLGNKNFMCGSELRLCDFIMYELLYVIQELAPEEFKQLGFQNLSDFYNRFENLDGVKQYVASDRIIKHPINNMCAYFL